MVLQGQKLFLARLAIGLAQGLALYVLYYAEETASWPATSGLIFGSMLMAWLYPPILLTLALGQVEWRRAVVWTLAAAALVAALGGYDVWSAWPQDWSYRPRAGLHPHILPSYQLVVFGGAGLFIAFVLVIGGFIDHKFRASYETHFDVAWKLALQLALAAVFVGIFWLLLWLGAGMFDLIKLKFFQNLIQHEWFAIPVTTMAVAMALHLTDIRPVLVRGARTLLLSLLSWLLPLIALISGGFLVSLPFTGLAPLWSFGHASALLLTDAAALIILVNATYQDGNAERMPPRILRYSGMAAACLPILLVIIAGYAFWLRLAQYGWSSQRVMLAAILVVAGAYAVGYVWAVAARGAWLNRLENWNFGVALLIVAVLLALFTPIANPERIAVSDQMARLANGKTLPGKFDYAYLRRQGGRYGQAALNALSKDKNPTLRNRALAYLKLDNPYQTPGAAPEELANRIVVYPAGTKLPDDFIKAIGINGEQPIRPACEFLSGGRCDAFVLDLDGDGDAEIMLVSDPGAYAQIFKRADNQKWSAAGTIAVADACSATFLSGLKQGQFRLSADPHPWQEIGMGNAAFPIQPSRQAATCSP